MKIEYEIEFGTGEDIDYVDVKFDCDFDIENDSFDHEFGTESYPDYAVLSSVTWDKSKHSEKENKAIQDFLDNEEKFCKFEEYAASTFEEDRAIWGAEPDEPDDRDYDYFI